MTGHEWVLVIGAVASATVTVLSALGNLRARKRLGQSEKKLGQSEKKLGTVVLAIDKHKDSAVALEIKRSTRKLSVEEGVPITWIDEETQKQTKRFERREL